MDDAFFKQAEKTVMKVLRDVQPDLTKGYGAIDFVTKHDNTVVTDLDKTIEAVLREALRPLDAGIGIVGEEMPPEGNTDTHWLLDPIDGTEHFIRGLPGCKNMVCLMDHGRPVWTLMFFFAKNDVWIARAGQGATRNDEKVSMFWRPLERCWLEMSVSLNVPENVAKILKLREHINGFAIRTGDDDVAAGRIDGVINIYAGGGPWDYWPRYLLFTETGGKMANLGKDDYDFDDKNFLVAHERNFDQLMQIVQS
jgi:fructose-1,6-bisphosphatase/inositol monophosphatase family enzyme